MNYEHVTYAVVDQIAVVTLNRPEMLNAMTARMGVELDNAMARSDGDDDVRAIVVTGAGRAFCAGADLGSGAKVGEGWGDAPTGVARKLPMAVRKPVIAAINGPAVGVGMSWPMQADIRYVAEDAKLAFSFVRRGVLPELASHVILAKVAGLSRAAELLLSGRMISGLEAVEYGIAAKAFPVAEVLPAAMELARDIAANTAPVPVALSKRLLWEGIGVDLAAVRAREAELFDFTAATPDAIEGIQAFLEKRPPRWTGRLSAHLDEL